MKARQSPTEQVLAKLKRIAVHHYDAIVELVEANKSIFDRPGLRPNAVDCLDIAIATAAAHAKDGEFACKKILASYDKFVSLVGAIKRSDYWSDNGKAGLFPSSYEATQELQALWNVFDRYVMAKLMQRSMSKYIERLRIPDYDKKYF